MKRIISVAILVMFSCSISWAQTLKIGHIDSHEVIQAMPELKNAQEVLQNFAKELEDAMGGMQKEFQDKYRDYQAKYESLSPVLRKSREDELQDIQRRVEQFRTNAQQELQLKEQELQQPIIDKVQKAIDDVARENNFTYIFDATPGNGILYKSPTAIDITPLVKKKLNLQ
ncbi:MAG TPA: OmpH family outer membrane protein [Salinivirgaceae bacterium]|nr:OmpH family outer membrane protein [Salinivirgaceae bacterium]